MDKISIVSTVGIDGSTDTQVAHPNRQWHLDELFANKWRDALFFWRAVDHEGKVLESYATKRIDRNAALKFLRKSMKGHGQPIVVVTDELRFNRAPMKAIGNAMKQEKGRGLNNRAENSNLPLRRRERAMIRIRQMRGLQ